MRKIELKTMKIGNVAGKDWSDETVGNMIKSIVEYKEGGMTIAEQRQCMTVHDTIEKAVETNAKFVLFEEADWNYLKTRVAAHKFPFFSPAFVQFDDAVQNAEKFDPVVTDIGKKKTA